MFILHVFVKNSLSLDPVISHITESGMDIISYTQLLEFR